MCQQGEGEIRFHQGQQEHLRVNNRAAGKQSHLSDYRRRVGIRRKRRRLHHPQPQKHPLYPSERSTQHLHYLQLEVLKEVLLHSKVHDSEWRFVREHCGDHQ